MEKIYGYKTKEYNFKEFVLLNNPSQIKCNKKFVLFLKNKKIYIYAYETNSFLNEIIEITKEINYFNFHCNNETILYVCAEYNVFIYEISNQKINKLCMIEGHFSDVFYASFNPFKSNIFLTASKNNTIKIYDITNTLPINLLTLHLPLNDKITFGLNKIGILADKNTITYFEYINYDKKNINEYKTKYIENFYFLSKDDSLIVITYDSVDIVENSKKIYQYKLNNKDNILSTFYLDKKEILIIIFNYEIRGFSMKYKNKLEDLFKFQQSLNFYINNPIRTNENLLNQDEICEIYQFNSGIMLIYTIKDNSAKQNNNNNIENNYEKINLKEIKKNICDIPLLISFKNNDYSFNNCPKTKKYFDIDEIQSELKLIKCSNLLERKIKVKTSLDEIDKIEDIRKKYILFLTLLVNDNTNIKLLEKYLTFLENNNSALEDIFKKNYENFEKELDYFSKALTNELNEKFYKKKVESQKSQFLKLIDKILNLNNDIEQFEKYLQICDNYFKNDISYFNMNINFSNEQLFYYRNINIFKYYLKSLYNNLLKEEDNEKRKNSLRLELEKLQYNINLCIKDLKNPKDTTEINSIILLLIFNKSKEEFIRGYNLIKAKGNINNLINSNDQNIIEYLKRFDYINIDLDLIKKFYKNILPSECFKSIFLELYGKDVYYPFENNNFTENFVENSFEVLQLPLEKELALNDKFTMKIYFIPFLSVIAQQCKPEEKNILRNGCFVKTGAHEIGHNFVNIEFFMENGKISIETPRKKSLNHNDCEGGKYIEYALFGKILDKITLDEALYILNEKNYEKSYLDFQNGFNNIKKENLEVKGTFENLCKSIQLNQNYINYSKDIFIPTQTSYFKEKTISCRNENDVLGRLSYNENYEKILIEYFNK